MLIRPNEKLYISLLLLYLSGGAYAQRTSRFSRPDEPGQLAVTVGLGAANYLGDLNERVAFRRGEIGFALAAGIAYRLSDHLSTRAEVRVIQVKGSQQGTTHEANNLSFRSTNPELTGGLQLDLLPVSAKPKLNPYLVVGVGFTYLSPAAHYQERWVRLPGLDTEGDGYSRLAVLASGGAGITLRLPSQLLLSLEVNHTLPSSDYVDDVSTVYPYASSLRGTEAIVLADRRAELGLPLHDPGDQRGFSPGKDTYLTGLIRLTIPLSSAKERRYRRDTNCLR